MKQHKTLDDVLADAAQWQQDHPWHFRWYGGRRRLRSVWEARRKPRWWWQRARRGYSVRDWWSFDIYISGVIARACRDFQEHGVGYPCDSSPEEWNALLGRIAAPLEAYAADKFGDLSVDEQVAQYEAARQAMHLFAEHLGGMWD